MASLFNFDGALTKREQIPNEMGFGVMQVQMTNREEVICMRLVTAITTKAISPGEMQPPNTANAAHATGGFM
ncbi:hypothetical protein [Cronobacter sakazakii]|uniref:hypothetical protein n=1 Tax=Cronobacter sakazakii TaxID=28141 RepID=UPI002D7A686A|nr:hypothetical protein [Cronobacter sakazakii]